MPTWTHLPRTLFIHCQGSAINSGEVAAESTQRKNKVRIRCLILKLDELKDLADYAISQARSAGASYAEARIHGASGNESLLKNGEPEPAVLAESFGIGVRVLAKGALGFSATNSLDRRSVKQLTIGTVKMVKSAGALLKKPLAFDASKPVKKKWKAEEKQIKLPGRFLTAEASLEEKYYVNSDGARVESRVPRVHFFGILTALENGETAQRMIQQGETGGLEVVERLDLVKRVEREAKTLGEVLRKATKPPEGTIDVVLSPELSGIAAHESVGHPQEADRILGREGAQAGESYLKRDSLGLKIGSTEANVSDDPNLPNSNGFSPVDDEGVEGKKRRLIQDGYIREFLQNRSTAAELEVTSNGASRSVAFNREPIIRMSNTFVEPGEYTLDELLKEVKLGVYFSSFTEWNIDDKRLNQRYVGLEAYLVEGGELKGLVKAPVLEITTPKLWGSVKARSRRIEFEAATCGKGDPMQGIPVWTGGPDTLLSGIKLGSR
ncbi:MAG: TldD/PmbA family protein [Thaumarchaeota archaeon]|nr:MAG: TldD/PmbA family protein [Nitrososphaerota archaeon]